MFSLKIYCTSTTDYAVIVNLLLYQRKVVVSLKCWLINTSFQNIGKTDTCMKKCRRQTLQVLYTKFESSACTLKLIKPTVWLYTIVLHILWPQSRVSSENISQVVMASVKRHLGANVSLKILNENWVPHVSAQKMLEKHKGTTAS